VDGFGLTIDRADALAQEPMLLLNGSLVGLAVITLDLRGSPR
jgi:hypothetical protein